MLLYRMFESESKIPAEPDNLVRDQHMYRYQYRKNC